MTTDVDTEDFHTLNSWYQEASNRLENAELVLLVYHHLVVLFDADEIRTRQAEAGVMHDKEYAIVEKARPKDTAKTIYRWNHIADQIWYKMTKDQREVWVRSWFKEGYPPGLSVVANLYETGP